MLDSQILNFICYFVANFPFHVIAFIAIILWMFRISFVEKFVGYIAIFLLISHGRLILDYAHCLANIRENEERRNFQNMMDDQFGEIMSLKNKINFMETILENKDKMIDTKTESEQKTSKKIMTLEDELNIQKRDLDSCMKIQTENEGK
eukprot:UN23704